MLGDTRYSTDYVCEKLNVHPDKVVEVKRIGVGKGFASSIFRISTKEKAYVVKIPKESSDFVSSDDMYADAKRKFHKREVVMYRYFNEHIEPGTSKIPRMYYAEETNEKEGMLVLEDFTDRLTKRVNFVVGYELTQVMSIIREIAAYQALSLSTTEQPYAPEIEGLHEILSEIVITCWGAVESRNHPWFTPEVKETVLGWSTPEALLKLQTDVSEEGVSPVLVHRDLWPNNMLFERSSKASGEGVVLAILDWQAAGVGPCMLDVASILGVTMSTESRVAHTHTVLQYYFDQILSHKDKFIRPFELTLEKAEKCLQRCLRHAVMQILMTAVYNEQLDVRTDGDQEGRLTKRLRHLVMELIQSS